MITSSQIATAAAVLIACAGCRSDKAADSATTEPLRNDAAIRHESGVSFPPAIGTFSRVELHRYDAAGKDVSVGYNDTHSLVAATVYVYPKGDLSLVAEFARRKDEVTAEHLGAEFQFERRTQVTPSHHSALTAEYEYRTSFAHAIRQVRSVLIVAECGPWFIEYRFTYASANNTDAAGLIRQFVDQWSW